MGYPEPVLEAVRIITNDGSKDCLDYIRDVKTNPIALAVKLADLKHNKAVCRSEQYRKALAVLLEEN